MTARLRISVWLCVLYASVVNSAAGQIMFEKQIAPILNSRCAGCHGETLPKFGLSVLTRGDLLEGGHSGPAVIPGSPEKSLVYKLVAAGKMPPGQKLAAVQIKLIESWIRAGASGKD